MELVDFTELRQVLQDLANDILANYKEHLEFNDRYTTERTLLDTVRTQVVVNDKSFEITMTLQDYWKYVEEGVKGDKNPSSPYNNPGWKAFPFILKWIDIKPVIPRPNDNGKLPSPQQLAFLITRSIVDKGTQGTHDLKKVEDGIIPFYKDKIAAALGHDMEHYIRKLVAER